MKITQHLSVDHSIWVYCCIRTACNVRSCICRFLNVYVACRYCIQLPKRRLPSFDFHVKSLMTLLFLRNNIFSHTTSASVACVIFFTYLFFIPQHKTYSYLLYRLRNTLTVFHVSKPPQYFIASLKGYPITDT